MNVEVSEERPANLEDYAQIRMSLEVLQVLDCVLGAIHRFAYPEFPNEAQLLWYKDLTCVTG